MERNRNSTMAESRFFLEGNQRFQEIVILPSESIYKHEKRMEARIMILFCLHSHISNVSFF